MRKRIQLAVAVALAAATFTPASGAAQATTRSTWDGVYSAEQAGRGGNLYQETCSSCHGPDMQGIDAAPPLTGGRFASNWNGVTLGDMVERIRISMPQNNPGSLSRAQIADVMAYILKANGFPPGERELPRQTSFLKQIAYDAYKPGG